MNHSYPLPKLCQNLTSIHPKLIYYYDSLTITELSLQAAVWPRGKVTEVCVKIPLCDRNKVTQVPHGLCFTLLKILIVSVAGYTQRQLRMRPDTETLKCDYSKINLSGDF